MKIKNFIALIGVLTALYSGAVFADDVNITDGCNIPGLPAQSKPWNPRNPVHQPCFPLPINDGAMGIDYQRGYSAGYAAGKRDLSHGVYNREKQIPAAQDGWSVGQAAGYFQAGQEQPQDAGGLG